MHLTGKNKQADLNLVPYIDLLTCMIAFLLITAVWTQLARLQVSRGDGPSEGDEKPMVKVVVMVGEQGFNLLVDGDRQVLPRTSGSWDFAALEAALHKVKAALPDKNDLLVSSEDAITYDTLIRTMDTVLAAGFPTPALVDSEARN
ncbi:MAG TPA: biopolymer transporter ExbD [Polyangia bacterium]|nr:biopolymer transporter ExbD [Polyangia bacterium]